KPVNDLRGEFGLPRISHDPGSIYTAGDLTLYPDIPEFVPIDTLPPNHHFIGVCPWRPKISKPAWWNRVIDSPRPQVFVSLRSSGPVKIMPAVLKALSQFSVEIIVSTSSRDVGALGQNIHAAERLPYEETAAHCAFVVSHGGTGGLYPALAAGAP